MIGLASASPELTVALALGAGVIAQSLAHHLRIPGIVILLGTGVLLGPDGAGIIAPSSLGHALSALTGFAVAIILFEGGLSLNLRRLRRAGPAIRNLLTAGALITALGGALAAKFALDWPWKTAFLFGTLVIVTGPTVVTPLLRRLKVERRVSTTLEAEGVFIDAIGAIIAVVALEVAISASAGVAAGLLDIALRLVVGCVLGLIGGALLAVLLRTRHVVPEGLENITTLALVIALFFVADALLPETGLPAVTVAGVVVGNARTPLHEELQEFKEQLTVMLIGLLFVLLAADVRLADVAALGWAGFWTVAVLMLVVRPINVWVSTLGTDMNWRQKSFLAWIAPRGIVAAAVASHFAVELDRFGIGGGTELRALVFLVIAATVVVAGLSGGFVARTLGLQVREGTGWVILGANELARVLARELAVYGTPTICIDSNPEHCRIASEEGLETVCGNGFDERTLHAAAIETAYGVVGLAPNEEVNLRFVETAEHESHGLTRSLALTTVEETVTPTMAHEIGATVLFGRDRDLDAWMVQLRHKFAQIEEWQLAGGPASEDHYRTPGNEPDSLLPLVLERGGKVVPVDDGVRYQDGDRVTFAVNDRGRSEATEWFELWGWHRVEHAASKSGIWDTQTQKRRVTGVNAVVKTP